MSISALSDYTYVAKYARYNKKKNRRETWNEAVSRVFDMHRVKYAEQIQNNPKLREMIDFAQQMQNKKRVLAAQRSLQFAGDPIFKHELKMFNCTFTHIDRPEVFAETMYALLCGCGVGFSVQKQHVSLLPAIIDVSDQTAGVYTIEDSIEGWSDAVNALMNSYFGYGQRVTFDFSLIRPEGSLIAGLFKAPGSAGLKVALEKMEALIQTRVGQTLRPIDAYDLIMHLSDAVLSGGVRRSATICIFSHDDDEMMQAKTGRWYVDNPQRGRSNNSAALLKGKTSRKEFADLMKSTREFGEPGFIWMDDLEIGYNPCCEIGMYPKTVSGVSGFQGCNLTEINGRKCDTLENFLEACSAAAIIGTLQAGYTDFKYLSPASKEIFESEALLGCSITGMMDNPDVIFNEENQRTAATMILQVNAEVAAMLGIKPAARATCVKPAGSTSCVLGTASGIHPHHARRYIRRVQANINEFPLKVMMVKNPLAVEKSVWSANGTDHVISFLCEVPGGSITKNQLSAVELLKYVNLTQNNWVEYGTRPAACSIPSMRHNVSNTITVKPHEWEEVEDYIFNNQHSFAGISLLPSSGDLDFAQAPFSTILTPGEIVKEYGDASVFASGVIVHALKAYGENLWAACEAVVGLRDLENDDQLEWVHRAKKFAKKYFAGDLKQMTYCLKHVSLWKTWCDLKREYVEIDWTEIEENEETLLDANTLGAQACSGGKCELF